MQADIRWLDQPEVFRVNRLDAHSDHRFFENEQTYQKKEETLRQSLNGIWKKRFTGASGVWYPFYYADKSIRLYV